ncbi:hypothetical protein SLEP1_g53626 [Rubroshorea leprosula]|uniref:Uncharacterized protein n=1 Tax=Rubroshorea leprosula TaxID=152421 RepID=A0AAV5MAT2_9ROSI|nr:hypothetical protein SLEP1_g53626 [Rubroshorea leprosula]
MKNVTKVDVLVVHCRIQLGFQNIIDSENTTFLMI